MQNYFTVLNKYFIPQLILLNQSMRKNIKNFNLFIIAIDLETINELKKIKFYNSQIVLFDHISKDKDYINIKKERSIAEFCSTVTPYIFNQILNKHQNLKYLIYIDTDMFFFKNPEKKINDFLLSNKSAYLTKHNFDNNSKHLEKNNGTFCVQFNIFKNNKMGKLIIKDWTEKCKEWCFYKSKNGKFGDQKYLEAWKDRYINQLYIEKDINFIGAPWNKDIISINKLYLWHFHSLRVIDINTVMLAHGYYFKKEIETFVYNNYINCLKKNKNLIHKDICQYKIEPLIFRFLKTILNFFKSFIFNYTFNNSHFRIKIKKI